MAIGWVGRNGRRKLPGACWHHIRETPEVERRTSLGPDGLAACGRITTMTRSRAGRPEIRAPSVSNEEPGSFILHVSDAAVPVETTDEVRPERLERERRPLDEREIREVDSPAASIGVTFV